MSIKDLSSQEKVNIIGKDIWHHSIDFGDGVVSPGGCSLEVTNNMANALFGNIDLSNQSVLDIGAWNGAYSFAAKRRGAIRVTASDSFCWKHEQFKGRETFEFACDLNGLDVEALEIDVPEITPVSAGYHDVVLFSGVFYHLVAPFIRCCACHTRFIVPKRHSPVAF